jgi:uncharacterized membrane protein YhaH (DUF805 family)
MDWYLGALMKYAVFTGRARRREYWTYTALNIAIFIVLWLGIDVSVLGAETTDAGVLSTIYSLVVIMPSVAVGVRRLHDTGRNALWFLLGLIPFVGGVGLIILLCLDSTPGSNKYGPNPTAVVSP